MTNNLSLVENVDLKESFSNMELIHSFEVIHKILYMETISANYILRSNNLGEFGICYKNLEDFGSIYTNFPFYILVKG